MTFDVWTVAAGAALALLVARRLMGGGRVSSEVVKEKLKAGAKVVDVRTPEEFRGGAYPGAVNIPLDALSSRIGEIPRDRPVIVYCASGGRSGVAATLLKRAGYADVVNAGGLVHMPR